MGDGRMHVPLVMIPENIKFLLENKVEVNAVSLKRHDETDNGVVLVFHFGPGQREAALEAGMKFLGVPR